MVRRPPLTYALKTKAVFRFCCERCNSRLRFSGSTALHCSSIEGHVEVCKLLIECEADVNAETSVHENPIDGFDARPLQILWKTKAGLRFFFERCNSCLLFSGETALHWASKHGHVEVCKLLVKSGANVNVKTPKDRWQQLSAVATSTSHPAMQGRPYCTFFGYAQWCQPCTNQPSRQRCRVFAKRRGEEVSAGQQPLRQ